jgi:uncharacterized protein (UPF0276 family)
MLLENPSSYLAFAESTYEEPEFLSPRSPAAPAAACCWM